MIPEPRFRPTATERALLVAAGIVLLVALAARVSNAFLLPPLKDYDAPGHALNTFALYEGSLPDPRSWSGFHPPLYYAAGALVWHLLPDTVPVHVALRLLSLAAGLAAVAIATRFLARRFPLVDAVIVGTVAFCAPVVAIATSMLGNETTCALFATAALARLCALPGDDAPLARHALVSGLLAGLAALSKATGLLAVFTVGLVYAWRLRRSPGRAPAVLLAAAAGPVLLLAPLYAHLLREAGSPAVLISGSVGSPDARGEMAEQPPGYRRLSHYLSFPASSLLAPVYTAPGLAASVPGLFYATLQADGQGQFLPSSESGVFGAGRALALAGLLPTGLALYGIARGARTHRRFAWAGPLALFAAILAASFLRYAWVFPHWSAVKASYALSGLLPAAAALAIGLDSTGGAMRLGLRVLLLAVALLDAVLLWQGLWVPRAS